MSKNQPFPLEWGPATRALRVGDRPTGERENSAPIFLTSSFIFESAAQAQAVFAETEDGNVYSRFTNPTVTLFEERLAALEGGERALATASGMAAITMVFLGLLSAGDHVVVSRGVFGSTSNIAKGILPRFGIQVSRVDLSDPEQWRQAITPRTRLFFLETPANPTLEMANLPELCAIARDHGILVAVDNVFCTPILQRPIELGADLVVQSATKYLDGQGRVLGGAVVGSERLIMTQLYPMLRNTGPSLSPFNAWILLKGMETLHLRMERHCRNALDVARFLEQNSRLAGRVRYPGLPSHPQHQLAARQMQGFGGLVCLELDGKAQAQRFIDGLEMITITANLGDSRTLVTHPATTTHGRLTPEDRAAAGVSDGLVRLSIGLEDVEDITRDLQRSLERL
ncbi:MAG: O-succinylhomoserine sulfhydrylase [Magnetococcales bacterium]|nr:O-succinylhomoserine sulfhydrylase [Magnetococcales bacterium]